MISNIRCSSVGIKGLTTAFVIASVVLSGCDLVDTAIKNRVNNNPTSKKPSVDVMAIESVEYYEDKLLDKNYEWTGPTSHASRIPVLHAARALAFIGDPAVPALLRAVENDDVDIVSAYDALAEVGLPVREYHHEIMNRDSSGIATWWKDNQHSSIGRRNQIRELHGLPLIQTQPPAEQ